MESKISPSDSEARLKNWLVEYLSSLLEIDVDEIDVHAPVAGYGLDSSGAVGMMGDLGHFLGRRLEPELTYRYTTIHSLAQHLASET